MSEFPDVGERATTNACNAASVFVVIPAFNEGMVLRLTVAGLIPYGYSVVVVDDGSVQPAVSLLKDFRIYYLRHVTNLGQGAALQTGTEFALQGGAQIVVHFDADGQHRPELIAELIRPISNGECDVVLGSRFIDRRDRNQVPFRKRVLLKIGVLVSGLFSGLWLTDTHNGFRALSAAAAQRIKLTENGFAHATEILEIIRRAGLRCREIPATIRYTDYSRSKGQSALNSINICLDLVFRKILG